MISIEKEKIEALVRDLKFVAKQMDLHLSNGAGIPSSQLFAYWRRIDDRAREWEKVIE